MSEHQSGSTFILCRDCTPNRMFIDSRDWRLHRARHTLRENTVWETIADNVLPTEPNAVQLRSVELGDTFRVEAEATPNPFTFDAHELEVVSNHRDGSPTFSCVRCGAQGKSVDGFKGLTCNYGGEKA